VRYFEATLLENRALGSHSFVLRLGGCESLAGTLPGQFVMLRADWGTDPLLPRAFSLLSVGDRGEVEILIKGAGKATRLFEHTLAGAALHVLGPLGSSFPAPSAERVDWLIAGGVGLAPLLMHAARARAAGTAERITMFYGGRTETDLVLLDDIAATGCDIVLATEDGSCGHAGYVTGAVQVALGAAAQTPTLLACGPDPMLLASARLAHAHSLPAYLSVEGEMACGVGACLVCAIPCASRPFRYACKDGPVLPLSDLAGPYAAPS